MGKEVTTEKRQWETGAVRDSGDGKEDYTESVSWLAMKRYAEYMTKMASKYGKGNWQKGIPPDSYLESFMRHWQKFISEWNYGICVERSDHLSAMVFNLFGLMHEIELENYGKGRFSISEEYRKLYPASNGVNDGGNQGQQNGGEQNLGCLQNESNSETCELRPSL